MISQPPPKPPATQYGMTESQAKEWIERLIREQQSLIKSKGQLELPFNGELRISSYLPRTRAARPRKKRKKNR